jgi:hypothetical protein
MMREGRDDRAPHGQNQYGGFSENPPLPTLGSVGIDKNLANRARQLDRMSEEQFEQHSEEYAERFLKPRGTAGTGEFERYTPSQYIDVTTGLNFTQNRRFEFS